MQHTPVLIIGSSMVGMTLSVLLAKHGIKGCITVEKHASTAIHPRAAYFHPRTMEIYREIGLYDAMIAESAKQYDINAGIYDVESLAGKHIQTWLGNVNEGIEDVSPVSRTFLTQHMFEPLLRRAAEESGANLQFSTELVAFQQDSTGVTAIVRSTETGEKRIVRAKYMVACDGNRSPVREQLGIKMQGHGLLSHSLTIYFKADVLRFIEGKYNGVIYVNNSVVRGFFRVDKSGKQGFLVVNTAGEQGTEESRFPADSITDARARELLRAAIGVSEEVDVEIELVAPWRAVCDCATTFNKARVLLAGDAAHTVTPHGGFGGNTGIQDAHNLAWKLALVLDGKAGADLVEKTYTAERHPVATKTVNQVYARYVKRTAPELAATSHNLEKEVPDPWIELGYRYHSAGLMTDELGDVVENPARATSRPGSKAPHVKVLVEGKDDTPIAHLFRGKYLFLLGSEAQGWEDAARALSGDKTLPGIEFHRIVGSAFYARYQLSQTGVVLVRPDGFIAWRDWQGPAAYVNAEGLLRDIFFKILCLTSKAADAAEEKSSVLDSKTPASTSLSAALFAREKNLQMQKAEMQTRIEQLDAEIADLRRMDELQNETALLALKLMPTAEKPPEYSYSQCLQMKESEGKR